MTKSTITRERIQRIIRAIDSEAYDEEGIREWLSSDEIMELARLALAAMDSEPVAEITDDLGRLFVKIHYPTTLRTGDKLYRHAQPATVVPECFVRFHDIIKERHYGRMPEEVHNAFDKCAAMLNRK